MSAVEQAGAILRAVATQQGPVTFGDIVRLTSLPKSSVHNVVRRLVEIGLLDSPGKNQYRIGWELVALASARLNDNDVVREFTRACEELPQLPDEGLVLSILDGSDMLYIATRATSRPFGIQYRIGMRLPAACTASGKAVLATRSDSEIRMMFKGQRSLALNPLVRKTISDLLIDVGETRKLGYAMDDEETAPGMVCIGAALSNSDETPANAAVAISLVKASVKPDQYADFGEAVMRLAKSISQTSAAAL